MNATIEQALQLMQSGRMADAIGALQALLAREPNNATAWANLGVALKNAGRADEGIAALENAVRLSPQMPELWYNLGNARTAARRWSAAVAAFEQAITLRPDLGPAWFNLGNARREEGLLEEAARAFEKALTLEPGLAMAWTNLGNVRRTQGRLDDAIAAHERALGLAPNNANALFNYANALESADRDDEANAAFDRAIAASNGDHPAAELNKLLLVARRAGKPLKPLVVSAASEAAGIAPLLRLGQALIDQGRYHDAERRARQALAKAPNDDLAPSLLAVALQGQGRDAEAIALFSEMTRRHPDRAVPFVNLGGMLNKAQKYEEALAAIDHAIARDPRMALAWSNKASALAQLNRLEEAVECGRRAVELDPESLEAHMQLAYALHYSGRLEDAREEYRTLLAMQPDHLSAWSNLLYSLSYSGGHTHEQVAAEHIAFGCTLESNIGPVPARRVPPIAGRKLRVGYVSPDLRSHSVMYFIEGLLKHHDRNAFEVFLYSTTKRHDDATERFRALGHAWRDWRGVDDIEATRQVERDGIDVLVDLAGHTADNTMGVFARRPAPVQVSYLGYPNTTGLSRIDYYLTDRWADPPGEHDGHFSEKLWRLDRCLLNWRGPTFLPPVGDLPARRNKHVTFGSFNNLSKYTPQVIDLWARVLQAVPGSRLLLKAKWFRDRPTRDRFWAAFDRAGAARERIDLHDFSPESDDMDIALDPFPYNGATTTCQALWMGLPVVALVGDSHHSRISHSILTSIGLPDLAVATTDEYVALAARLAGDLDHVAELRRTMRERLRTSPIGDEAGFTRAVEDAWRAMAQAAV